MSKGIFKKKGEREEILYEWVIDGDEFFNFKLFYNYIHSLIFVILSIPLAIFFWLVLNFSLYFPEFSNKIIVGVLWQFVMAILVMYWGALFYYKDKKYKYYISNKGVYTDKGLMPWNKISMAVKFKPGIMLFGHTDDSAGAPQKYYIPLNKNKTDILKYLEKQLKDKIKES